ncbi:hypothetical protein LZ30DRAFT_338079 [Colletotrichum cereale]|nr:hypothetical protein LZ30DRAFT_338079 [Colletotrichum cereale]
MCVPIPRSATPLPLTNFGVRHCGSKSKRTKLITSSAWGGACRPANQARLGTLFFFFFRFQRDFGDRATRCCALRCKVCKCSAAEARQVDRQISGFELVPPVGAEIQIVCLGGTRGGVWAGGIQSTRREGGRPRCTYNHRYFLHGPSADTTQDSQSTGSSESLFLLCPSVPSTVLPFLPPSLALRSKGPDGRERKVMTRMETL